MPFSVDNSIFPSIQAKTLKVLTPVFPSYFPLLHKHLNHQQICLWFLQIMFRITLFYDLYQNIPVPSHHHFSPAVASYQVSFCTSALHRAYIGCVTSGSPQQFLQHYSQSDVRTCIREYTCPLLRILPWIEAYHIQSKSPRLSSGLDPATSSTLTLSPFLLLIYSCFHIEHAFTSMLLHPLFSPLDFQWALPSLISCSFLDFTSIVRLSLTTLHEWIIHILSLLQPQQYLLFSFADLFYYIATYY